MIKGKIDSLSRPGFADKLKSWWEKIKRNPATEAAGPCVNKKLGGGLSANHI